MTSNKLLIFALITIAAIVAATMMSHHSAPTTSVQKTLLFPDLLHQVNNIDKVRLTAQDKSLTLLRKNKQWMIQQADNYPADFDKIRGTVIAVAELMVLAEKTSNPKLYKRLGVEDPLTHTGSLQLSLYAGDNTLAALIVGKFRRSKSPGDKPGLYVRLPDAPAALLVAGQLDVSADVMDWFKRNLFSIKANRIKHIQITQADGSTVILDRDKNVDDFDLGKLPRGLEKQSNVIISSMGTLLENIFVDNVINAEKLAGAEKTTASIHTFDGLIVTVVSAGLDGHNYSTFSFSVDKNMTAVPADKTPAKDKTADSDKPDPSAEAQRLNKTVSGWAYSIPEFKYKLFTKKLSELTRKTDTANQASKKDKDSS